VERLGQQVTAPRRLAEDFRLLSRLGGADQTTVQAGPSDEEPLIVEDLEPQRVAAGRAESRIWGVRLHAGKPTDAAVSAGVLSIRAAPGWRVVVRVGGSRIRRRRGD
jgi:hypothetical protein